MKVGLVLPLAAEAGPAPGWPRIRALARHAETGGLDSLWVYDHLLWREPAADGSASEGGPHEAFTVLAALAAATERVELGSIVFATSFRPPALLAKMAVTADAVAGGRLILGLGCGWQESEYSAFGYPFDHRVGRFEEALEVIVPLLDGRRVTFTGRWTQVDDAVLLPPPSRRMPILVAAKGPRMLRLTARHADAWNTAWFARPDARFQRRLADLREACAAEGRDPASLTVTVGVEIDASGKAKAADDPPVLTADASAMRDAFAAWQAEGAGHLQVNLDPVTESTIDLLLEATHR